MFGFDIIIDENFEVYLLEINRRADIHIYDKKDEKIKQDKFIDTLNIIGIIIFSHDENQEPLDDEYKNDDQVQEAIDIASCELTRPKGYFDLIFPLKKNIDKYAKFFRKKNIENEKFWDKIKNEE